MPNVHLTRQMEDYVESQIASGAYANVSEVVRAGMRALMEQDGARDYYRLRAELEAALVEGERSGPGEPFDVEAFLAERTRTA